MGSSQSSSESEMNDQNSTHATVHLAEMSSHDGDGTDTQTECELKIFIH